MPAAGALRDPALRIFVASRIAIGASAVLSWFWLRPGTRPFATGHILDVWTQWDGSWFMRIAEHFYSADPFAGPAFYPLYPGVVGVVARALGGRYALAGVAVSLVACGVAFVLLRRLAELELGNAADAARAVLYLALFPLSFFLQAVYGESLYLALALGAFLAARRERWGIAALCCAGCCLTRATGVAVVAGVLVLAWQSPLRRRASALVALSVAAIAIFPLELSLETGKPGSFIHAERVWHRTLSPAGPLGGLWKGAVAAWHGVGLAGGTQVSHAGLGRARTGAVDVEYFLWLVVFVVLAILVWRRLGPAYGVFAALSVALPLCYPSTSFPLFSISRFGVVVFPFFIVLAQIGRDRRRNEWILWTSTVLLALYVARWSLGSWVA